MSQPQVPRPGRLFLSILSAKWELFQEELVSMLKLRFGETDYISPFIPFTESDYYNRELGTPIYRRILTFRTLVALDRLAEIKLLTNELETRFSRGTNRIINLDPGLLTLERLVLASGKNFTHRIYLGRGIWADLTLVFVQGDWRDLPWTFPDYASEKLKSRLRTIRYNYYLQLKAENLL